MALRILTNIENIFSKYSVIFFIPRSGALNSKTKYAREWDNSVIIIWTNILEAILTQRHRVTEYQRQTPYYIQSSQRRLHRKEFTKRAHRRSFYILFKAKPSLCSESRVSLCGSVSLCEPYKSKLICNIKVSDKTPSPRTSLPERTAAKNRGENGGFYGKQREETEKTVVWPDEIGGLTSSNNRDDKIKQPGR